MGRTKRSDPPLVAVGVAVALELLLGGPAATAKAECPPTACVEGDAPAADAVREALGRRGIRLEPERGCPCVSVAVEQREQVIWISIEDPFGRRSERSVSSAETAAVLVSSWVRQEDGAWLLAPKQGLGYSDGSARPLVEKVPQPEAAGETTADWLGVGVGADFLYGGDGSCWVVPRLGACLRLGPSCLGLEGKALFDSGLSGDSRHLQTSRSGFDAVVFADFPLRAGSMSIVAGGGVGLGWLRSSRSVSSGSHEGLDESDSVGLKVDLHVLLDLQLGGSWSVNVGPVLGLSPLAHTSSYTEEETGLQVAGEPLFVLGLSAAIKYGGE